MPQMSQILGSNPLATSQMQPGLPLDVLSQMTPASPNFQPDLQIPPNPPMPDRSPMSGVPMNQPPQPATQPQMGVPQLSPVPLEQVSDKKWLRKFDTNKDGILSDKEQAAIIVQALAGHLGLLGKKEAAKMLEGKLKENQSFNAAGGGVVRKSEPIKMTGV